jgi:DNA-binding MarR family transcriptional regulator
MDCSETERFERACRRLWEALHRAGEPDLSRREMELLHRIPAAEGVPLTHVARHLGLPKSTASLVVKALERRGFLERRRDRRDERRLALVLTEEGRRRVAADRLFDPDRLAAALATLPLLERGVLIEGLERLAVVSEEPVDAAATRGGGR